MILYKKVFRQFLSQHEEVERRRKNLHKRIRHLKSQVDTLHTILSQEKRPVHYKVVAPEKLPDQSKISLVSTIANAILREPDAVPLVAYCPNNCLEMEKDWDLMTDFDKEEILQKKIYREL
ncbi:MAG: hypothetical protein IK062_02885 [Selenomonadaceae bacterium]|nr:hypothetical protein [Selenomonadaceae bacterium]